MAGLGGEERVGNIIYFVEPAEPEHPLFRDGTYYPTNPVHLSLRRQSSVFPQEDHRSAAANQTLLMGLLGKSAAQMYYDSTAHQEIITERLITLTRVRQDLLATFQVPLIGDPDFFYHCKEKLWKLMNFNAKVLTESAVSGRFAIPNYFNSVYYSESTHEFVVVGGPNIAFTPATFRQMVLDCMSMMVLFSNYVLPPQPPGQRPPHNYPFSSCVPMTLQLFRGYLDSADYLKYEARAAFDFQYFWSYKDQDEFARFSAEQYKYNNPNYQVYADRHLPHDWSSKLPVGTLLHTQYTESQALPDPPDYSKPGNMPWFVRCSIEHIKRFRGQRQLAPSFVLNEMDALFQYSYYVFITNLEYASNSLHHQGQRAAYLAKLGFRYYARH